MAAVKEENESIGEISFAVQLETTNETLCKVKALRSKQADVETAERAVSNLRACLKDEEGALEVTIVCAVCSWGVKQLQVVEKKRIIQVFQKQIDNISQIVGVVQMEKIQLSKEISDWKLKTEELNVSSQLMDASGDTPKKPAEKKIKRLQNQVETLQMNSQALASVIKNSGNED